MSSLKFSYKFLNQYNNMAQQHSDVEHHHLTQLCTKTNVFSIKMYNECCVSFFIFSFLYNYKINTDNKETIGDLE